MQATLLQLLLMVFAMVGLVVALLGHIGYKYHGMALMVRNMFEHILHLPSARALPINDDGHPQSSGQVISTFRDDANEIADMLVRLLDNVAFGVAAIISLVIMWQISPLVTLGTFLPMGLIVVAAQMTGRLVKKYRTMSREATSRVTGLIGDMFNGTQAIKVAHAEDRIVEHFTILNDQRRDTMVKDRVLTQLVDVLGRSSTAIGTGLILLFAATAMHGGAFTVGDFALFTTNIWTVTTWMQIIGNTITKTYQVGVSFGRMETIMQGAPRPAVTTHHPVYEKGDFPAVPFPEKKAADKLTRLRVEGLTYCYPESGNGAGDAAKACAGSNGIAQIDLDLPRGSFTVITGRIGSGKTTLLKVLLGMLPRG